MTSDTSIGKDSEDSLTYFNDGGGSEWIFGSETLAKSDFFFWSMKDAGNFWVTKKTEGFFGLQKKD